LAARPSAAVTAVLAAFAVSACGAGSGSSEPVTASGDAARCPGQVVDVVVSVGQWSDLARRLGGDCATVTTVLASSAVDPHDFEPRPADIAAFEGADVVVLNGAGYDTWAADAVGNLDRDPAVVTAADLTDGEDGDNPHLWYDPGLLPRMASAVTAALTKASPDAAERFRAQARAWEEQLQPYTAELDALRAVAAGLVVLDPRAAPALVAAAPRLATESPAESLTARERDVLALVAQGLPNKTIAQRLAISEHTVKFHVGAILAKLGAASRTEAVRLAARRGLIAL
jgi:zinc/manganese transport system substrate-binding protein